MGRAGCSCHLPLTLVTDGGQVPEPQGDQLSVIVGADRQSRDADMVGIAEQGQSGGQHVSFVGSGRKGCGGLCTAQL